MLDAPLPRSSCRNFFLLRAMLPPSHARSFFSSRCNARFRGGLVKRQVCVCGRSASSGVWDAEFGVLPSSGRFVRADGSFSGGAYEERVRLLDRANQYRDQASQAHHLWTVEQRRLGKALF